MFSGCIPALLEFNLFPVQLKTLSLGTLVTGTHRYFLAKVEAYIENYYPSTILMDQLCLP